MLEDVAEEPVLLAGVEPAVLVVAAPDVGVLDAAVPLAVVLDAAAPVVVVPVAGAVGGAVVADVVPAVDVPVPAGLLATNCSSAESNAE